MDMGVFNGSTGKFYNLGGTLGTTYSNTGDGLFEMIDDFYGFYRARANIAKSAGAAVYGDNGYFNAIYGQRITAAMYMGDNVFSSIGARPYDHEGQRITTEMADYGLDENDEFVGLGAFTIQDGKVPNSVSFDVHKIRMPYKEAPFAFDYGLGLMAIEGKDDTSTYNQYIDIIQANYADLADKTILRPVSSKQPTVSGVETSLNSIGRVIASADEIGKVENNVTITEEHVSPWGGFGDNKGDMYSRRAGKKPNWSGQVIDAAGGVITDKLMTGVWKQCMTNWTDSGNPNGKCFFMSPAAIVKISAIQQAQQMYTNTVFVQRDFNGVKTVPGRDTGFIANSFQNIPMLPDGNIAYDYKKKEVSKTVMGDVYLLDTSHIWLSMLTPVQQWSNDNVAISRQLREQNVINMRAELRADSFIQHGRIVNLADEAA